MASGAIIFFLLANWLIRRRPRARALPTRPAATSRTHDRIGQLLLVASTSAFFVKLYLILLGVVLVLLAIGLLAGAFKGPVPA